MNYYTFIGFQNYLKFITKKDALHVPVSAVQSLYLYYLIDRYSYKRGTSEILLHCILQKWCRSDVDSQKL
jgi:hypothetical protein